MLTRLFAVAGSACSPREVSTAVNRRHGVRGAFGSPLPRPRQLHTKLLQENTRIQGLGPDACSGSRVKCQNGTFTTCCRSLANRARESYGPSKRGLQAMGQPCPNTSTNHRSFSEEPRDRVFLFFPPGLVDGVPRQEPGASTTGFRHPESSSNLRL